MNLLEKDLEFFTENEKLSKIIFDLFLEVSKAKEIEKTDKKRFEKILNLSFKNAILNDHFYRNTASKYLVHHIKSQNESALKIFRTKTK